MTHVKDHDFIRNRFVGIGKGSAIRGWLVSYYPKYSNILFIYLFIIIYSILLFFLSITLYIWSHCYNGVDLFHFSFLTFILWWTLLQHSFFKQFYGSVTKSDYVALRLGFITVRTWTDILLYFYIIYTPFWCKLSFLDTLQGEPKVQFSQVHDTRPWRWF